MSLLISCRRIARPLLLFVVVVVGILAGVTLVGGTGYQAVASSPNLVGAGADGGTSLPGKSQRIALVSPTVPPCGLAWRTVSSPLPPAGNGTLRGVEALSTNDVWAVGYTGTPFSNPASLSMHWDGSAWSVVPVPGAAGQILYGVSGTSSNDLWAVGNIYTSTLILHWNGTQWATVPSPSPSNITNVLYGVAAVSPNDAWAVGQAWRTQGSQTLIFHWDGVVWTQMPAPNPNWNENALYGVSALAANDVWAVGAQPPHYNAPITLHWDGASWNVVSNPLTPIGDYIPDSLLGVGGTGATDVWAVGRYRNSSWSRTLIERWNGSQWAIVPSADGNLQGDNELTGVSALSAGDVWAVGWYLDNGATGRKWPLIEHWDGSAWSQVPAPELLPVDYQLYGIDSSGPTDLWAAGTQAIDSQNVRPYTLRYNDPCLTPTPTSTAGSITPTPTRTSIPSCSTGWSVIASPNIGADGNFLNGVSASSASDAWAVGYFLNSGTEQTLALHWDGTTWEGIGTPNAGSGDNRLTGVANLSPADAWAVGYYIDTGGASRGLVLHWDGTQWAQISIPPSGDGGALKGVAAIAPNDIWAVGFYTDQSTSQPLTLHWNGTAWSVVPTPAVFGFTNEFRGVSGSASNDVWAAGIQTQQSYPDTLVMHWNGTAWSEVASPSPGSQYDDQLTGVTSISPNEAWAVGHYMFSGLMRVPLALRWDGTQWTQVQVPGAGNGAYLDGLSGQTPNNIWAVGHYMYGSPAITRTMALRWNGSTWGTALTQDPGSGIDTLQGAAVVSGNETWAVGYAADSGSTARTLVEHFVLACASPTPTPTGTPPTATPTRTPTRTPTITLTRTRTPTFTPTPICPPAWATVDLPPVGSLPNIFNAIDGPSPSNMWAAGQYYDTGLGRYQTLTEHWDGSTWSLVASANATINDNQLLGVKVRSADDVWAVGYSGNYTGNNRTLILHWDGTAWSVLPSPNPSSNHNVLLAVDATAQNDAWAVGAMATTSGQTALTLHWDGSTWQVAATSTLPNFTNLTAVKAFSANDVWAVGTTITGSIALHWDGSQWNIVTTPASGYSLAGVDGTAPNDIWAAGYDPSNNVWMLHWDGTAFSRVTVNLPPNQFQHLYIRGVSTLTSTDAWAVGDGATYVAPYYETVMLHWNGASWARVTSPNPDSLAIEMHGVAFAAPDDVFAAGWYRDVSHVTHGLVERYSSSCSTATATPIATSSGTPSVTPTRTATSSGSPTATATPIATSSGTPSVTPTPTGCAIEFTDVPPGSTFYPYVICLACRGIINGYSDGTFRPNNLVTRGQLSKIVSNAAGFSDPQTTQMFQDVPAGSTFFDFVGRLASRGYIGGYSCGGAGEPCVPPGNLPYFRPNNNATRGQISKIVSNAAGFQEPHTEQSFQDVPVGSTFYDFIERLASRSVMGGYNCGGPGEPCIGPENRPYFRPNNNATRGQTSKIVGNTFFPNCQTP